MRLKYLVLFVVFVHVNAGQVWLKDLTSPNGLDLGYGAVLKLNEIQKARNVPIMERLSLDLNLGDLFGVSVAKAKRDGVELDFYVKKNWDVEEGRGKKDEGGKYVMPMVIGYKAAVLITSMFAVMKVLTLKAIFLAKAALIISFFVLILKLKDHRSPEIIEVEQHGYPAHSGHFTAKDLGLQQFGGFGGAYGNQNYGKDAQSSNIYQDVVYAPSAAGSSAVEPNSAYGSSSNEPAVPARMARNGPALERKRDNIYTKTFIGANGTKNMLSLKRYFSPDTS
ncbi:hypothetical protein ABEB36_010190 [Hypothenemus hampei]|uniref:Uncharacterized protein n=1 Tax=Hypothenemus hampei TaxID=57062 RepID=A0ABD1ELS0_HYPHA